MLAALLLGTAAVVTHVLLGGDLPSISVATETVTELDGHEAGNESLPAAAPDAPVHGQELPTTADISGNRVTGSIGGPPRRTAPGDARAFETPRAPEPEPTPALPRYVPPIPEPSDPDPTERVLPPASLSWLKSTQAGEGYWDTDNPSSEGADPYRVFVTAMAMQAFLSHGSDHKSGEFRATLRMAVLHLRKLQRPNGMFVKAGDPLPVMQHAAATAAMCEAYGISGDVVLKALCDKAVQGLLQMRNPIGAWGNVAHETELAAQSDIEPNMLATGWALLALQMAETVGLKFQSESRTTALQDAGRWAYDRRRSDHTSFSRLPETGTGFDHARISDAAFVLAVLHGKTCEREDLFVQGCLARLAVVPAWDTGTNDFIAWWFTSKALRAGAPKTEQEWLKGVGDLIAANQHGYRAEDRGTTIEEDTNHGSWDHADVWGSTLGRAYTTAMATLLLQAPASIYPVLGDD